MTSLKPRIPAESRSIANYCKSAAREVNFVGKEKEFSGGDDGFEPEQGHFNGCERVLSGFVFGARPAPSSSQYRPILPGLLHDYCTEVARTGRASRTFVRQ
jgi:hypothetical protein